MQGMLLASKIQALFKESAVKFDGHSQCIAFSIGVDNGEGNKLFINAKAASKEARVYPGWVYYKKHLMMTRFLHIINLAFQTIQLRQNIMKYYVD